MVSRDDDALGKDSWHFAARMYLSTMVFTFAWKMGRGDGLDAWTVAWLVGCLIGWTLPRVLDWDGQPRLSLHINILGATIVQALYVAYWYEHPVMMVIPCFGALYVATTQRWPWIFYQMGPALVVLAFVASDRNGLRVGLADTVMYANLWASIGLIAAWMRSYIDRAADELVAAQAEEASRADQADERTRAAMSESAALEQRAALAASLQSDITEVAGASAGIEEQSSAIANSVEEMVTSLRETSETARRAEESLGQISTAADASKESIARLDSAGQEIVGSTPSPSCRNRPTSWPSTPPSRRPGPARPARASPSWPTRSRTWPSEPPGRLRASPRSSTRSNDGSTSRPTPRPRSPIATLEQDQLALATAMSQQIEVIEEISAASANSASGVSGIGETLRRLDTTAAELGADGVAGGATLGRTADRRPHRPLRRSHHLTLDRGTGARSMRSPAGGRRSVDAILAG